MNTQKKHPIIIPYDFTGVSDTAISHAARFSQISGNPLLILNIIDESTGNYLKQHNQMDQFIHAKLKVLCKETSAKFNIEVSFLIKKGNILSIRKIADDLSISFMFMGIDQPHTNASKVMKVVCTSPAPVYVVQGNYEFADPKYIIVPIDDFVETRQKVQCATTCSKLFKATIKLLSIKPTDKTQLFKQNVIVSQIERVLHEERVPFTFEYAKGKPADFADELLEFAQQVESRIFVLMKTPRIFSPNKITAIDKKVLLNSQNIPAFYVNPRDVGRYY
ncbi:MAG: hypothetical protein V1904_00375 [Bacteroidota bacterium]